MSRLPGSRDMHRFLSKHLFHSNEPRLDPAPLRTAFSRLPRISFVFEKRPVRARRFSVLFVTDMDINGWNSPMAAVDPEQNPFLRDPDVRLMLRAKADDDAAFSQLVANYQNRLVGVLTHLLQSREWAEDLAQEVFLRIYRARHGYQPTARFSTWMFQIANNLARN